MNLIYLAGLSQNKCDCRTDLPEGDEYRKSETGVFIDEDPAFSFCRWTNITNFWDLLSMLRDESLSKIKADLLQGWKPVMKRLQPFQERIGQAKYSGANNSASSPFGFDIQSTEWGLDTTDYRRLFIEGLAIIGTVVGGGTTTITFTVRNISNNTTVREEIFTNVGSNQTVRRELENPIELIVDGSLYSFTYTSSVDFIPVNNMVHCDCGDKLKGFVTYIEENQVYAEGLSMLVSTGCKKDTLLDLQVQNEDYSLVLGYMLRYKTLEALVLWIDAQPDISRYSLLERKKLTETLAYFHKEYTDRLDWMLVNNPETDHFCYYCSTKMKIINTVAGSVRY